jgi:hypothetical protein
MRNAGCPSGALSSCFPDAAPKRGEPGSFAPESLHRTHHATSSIRELAVIPTRTTPRSEPTETLIHELFFARSQSHITPQFER